MHIRCMNERIAMTAGTSYSGGELLDACRRMARGGEPQVVIEFWEGGTLAMAPSEALTACCIVAEYHNQLTGGSRLRSPSPSPPPLSESDGETE